MSELIATLPDWSIWIVVALAVVLLLLLVRLLVGLRRRGGRLERALSDISYDRLSEIIVPKADEGEIQVQHVLLTARGILVVDTKDVEGVVFASDRMDDWTVITGDRRYTFANPQPALYDRMAAIMQLTDEIPVEGRILFPASADFSKGRPRHVCSIEQLLKEYPLVDRRETRAEVSGYMPKWERLRQEAVSARMGKLAGD